VARKRRRRAHGQGCVYERGPGNWWLKWREGGRVRYEGGLLSREVAQQVLNKVVADLAAGRAGLPRDPKDAPLLEVLAKDWLERRKLTHRSADDDQLRWTNHLKPWFGKCRPSEVDQASLRRFIEAKLAEELSPATVRLCIMLLSSFFGDLVEQGHVQANPVRALTKAARRLIKPSHDPRTTPFIEKLDDVRRLYLALPEPVNVAYAIGAMAGLRTGEVLALRWEHVNMEKRRIHVRESVKGPLKDKESRVVIILDGLHSVLAEWKLRTGGAGTVVPPMRSDGKRCDQHTVGKYLRKAVNSLQLPKVTWYQATRHTFASHWVLSGGSIEKLKEMLGHCSVLVTERYSHLRPDLFAQRDFGTIALDLKAGGGGTALQGRDCG
jgi:integrase